MNDKIMLKDLGDYGLFVLLRTDYKSILIKKAISKAGSQSKLAKLIKDNLDYPKMRQAIVSSLIKRKTLQLDILCWLCNFIKIKLPKEYIIGIKGRSTSRFVYKPKLPIIFSSELAQILANLYCDGCIEKDNCYVSTYTNSCEDLINRFKNNFIFCFGKTYFYERETHLKNVRIPCFIGRILYDKFSLGEDKIPCQIKNAGGDIKKAYLQAVFDDEGGIHKNHGQIRLKMKSNSYLKDVKELLHEFNIKTSDIIKETDKRTKRSYYYFLISGIYNLKIFSKEIDFFHPKKKKILMGRMNSIKLESYGYKSKYLVLDVLKEYGPLTVEDISKKLKRSKRVINMHLNNLKKEGFISYTKIKRKFSYEYLWKMK